ncbi:MAG: alpha/beta hydrolase-fold protein [Planctomycetota bacterium]
MKPKKTAPAVVLFCAATALAAQGRVDLTQVHAPSLEGNRSGESPRRTVAVYLPPSYNTAPERRYPVLHLLHGIGGTHADWTRPGSPGPGQSLQDLMDRGIAAGAVQELIVVACDQRTSGGGSFYTNSALTGAWEDFTVRDLVGFIDEGYRTVPDARSRGVAGHSMGGYGAIKLGMKHPDVFAVVYGLSPAVLGFAEDLTAANPAYERAARLRPEELNPRLDMWPPSLLCIGQALSANPQNPPHFCDLPFAKQDGAMQPTDAHRRWREQMPLYMAANYVEQLRSLRALRFDTGSDDEYTHILATCRAFSAKLAGLGVPHVYEEYNGDHRNRLWGPEGRLATEVLPFFSRQLQREAPVRGAHR